jgi:hypothetical protein
MRRSRHIRVCDIREAIAGAPDDAVLVVPAPDHSYRPASLNKGTALFSQDGHISEDFETDDPEVGERRNVVIVT